MATTSSKQAKTTDVTSGAPEVETSAAENGQTQIFFVPEYNISVEALSINDAVAKAKKIKGAK